MFSNRTRALLKAIFPQIVIQQSGGDEEADEYLQELLNEVINSLRFNSPSVEMIVDLAASNVKVRRNGAKMGSRS